MVPKSLKKQKGLAKELRRAMREVTTPTEGPFGLLDADSVSRHRPRQSATPLPPEARDNVTTNIVNVPQEFVTKADETIEAKAKELGEFIVTQIAASSIALEESFGWSTAVLRDTLQQSGVAFTRRPLDIAEQIIELRFIEKFVGTLDFSPSTRKLIMQQCVENGLGNMYEKLNKQSGKGLTQDKIIGPGPLVARVKPSLIKQTEVKGERKG